MPFNGSGTYTLPANSIQADGTTADAADVNTPFQDIETALSSVILRNGAAAFTDNQSMGSKKLTNLAAGTAAADAPRLDQVQSGIVAQATAVGGTVDAITLTFSPVFTAYTSGMRIRWVSGGENTTTPTVNVDGLGTKNIRKHASVALVAGDTGASGYICEAVYDGTRFILLNPYKLVEAQITTAATGQQTIWMPAAAMIARTTNGASSGTMETTTNKVMVKTLDFDKDAIEYAQFAIQMPKSWDEGTLIAQFIWTHGSGATAYAAMWGIQAAAFADDDALDGLAFGTTQTVTDTGGTADDVYISAETSAITVAGSPTAEELVYFQVSRRATQGADTLDIDAKLIGAKIHYTTASVTDS